MVFWASVPKEPCRSLRTPKCIESIDISKIVSTRSPDEKLSIPLVSMGLFQNPWATSHNISRWDVFKWFLKSKSPTITSQQLALELPVLTPNWSLIDQDEPNQLKVTWMGHSCFLVQLEGFNILTDPVWSNRCSPCQFVGPKRIRPPPCKINELPPIDIVIISHNHYDHLDYYTISKLGNNPLYITPKGHSKWFKSMKIDHIIEFDWWDKYIINSNFHIVCLPAQHWSKRTIYDSQKALWSGWGLFGSQKKIFFAGDTGYCRVFKEIGNKFGPFDLSLIPIGAYEPRWIMSSLHVSPKEAVKIHVDVKSKQSIGMHWGTWILSSEEVLDPPKQTKKEMIEKGLNPDHFITIHHGDTFCVHSDNVVEYEQETSMSALNVEISAGEQAVALPMTDWAIKSEDQEDHNNELQGDFNQYGEVCVSTTPNSENLTSPLNDNIIPSLEVIQVPVDQLESALSWTDSTCSVTCHETNTIANNEIKDIGDELVSSWSNSKDYAILSYDDGTTTIEENKL